MVSFTLGGLIKRGELKKHPLAAENGEERN